MVNTFPLTQINYAQKQARTPYPTNKLGRHE